MRRLSTIALLICSACGPSRQDLLADAERTQAETIRRAPIKHSVQVFGGTVLGKDMGEWGGEVAFREPDGRTYRVIADNSHGVFDLPFGVVALTGLAHLSANRGAVYLLTRESGRPVSATMTLRLPGAPCDAAGTGDRVFLRVLGGFATRGGETDAPVYDCYVLRSSTRLTRIDCPVGMPDFCRD